jgi:hypothetical protein
MSKAAGRLDQASMDGRLAFQDLRELATTVDKPLAMLAGFNQDLWKVLAEVRDSLKPLAASEKRQVDAVLRLTQGLSNIAAALSAVSDGVAELCHREGQRNTEGGRLHDTVVAMQTALGQATSQIDDIQDSVSELRRDGDPALHSSYSGDGRMTRKRSQGSRTWWQKVFG